jgi:uncharacterized protein YkwD
VSAHACVRLPAILATALALVLSVSAPAGASTRSRAAFVSDTNHARANHDRRAYRVQDRLDEVAQRWANWMAAHHSLRHNPYLASQCGNWRDLGENVGRGPSESGIQRAFMNSPSHRDNILSRTFTQFGVGTARSSDGKLYVDEVFRRPD